MGKYLLGFQFVFLAVVSSMMKACLKHGQLSRIVGCLFQIAHTEVTPISNRTGIISFFAGKDIETENCVPEGTFINADPVQTEQVLKSYLENAASHTPDGGKVWTEASKNDGTVRISVFNTGSHVDEEIMPQIWQSFFRSLNFTINFRLK